MRETSRRSSRHRKFDTAPCPRQASFSSSLGRSSRHQHAAPPCGDPGGRHHRPRRSGRRQAAAVQGNSMTAPPPGAGGTHRRPRRSRTAGLRHALHRHQPRHRHGQDALPGRLLRPRSGRTTSRRGRRTSPPTAPPAQAPPPTNCACFSMPAFRRLLPPLAASFAAMQADVAALVSAISGAGGSVEWVAIIASPAQAGMLMVAAPDMRVPVWSTRALADGTIMAVDTSAFASAFDATPGIRASKEAVLHFEDTPPLAVASGAGVPASWRRQRNLCGSPWWRFG